MPTLRHLLTAGGHRPGHGAGTIEVEMAQKVTVVLEDDLTGGPAEQTVRFAFDGTDYEIDLNAKNAAKFGKQLAPYLEHARRAGRATSRRPGRTAAHRQRSGTSGPGPTSTASRSANAAASRPAWWSNTRRPTAASTSHHRRAAPTTHGSCPRPGGAAVRARQAELPGITSCRLPLPCRAPVQGQTSPCRRHERTRPLAWHASRRRGSR